MEARIFRAAAFLAAAISLHTSISPAASSRTQNFIIEAPTPELAEKIGKAAEHYRRELAIDWIGSPMPNWSRPCPIRAEVSSGLGAGGATSFVFDKVNGKDEVFGWDMKIQGSEERVLDSVLPHEITHTIFASYFRRPLPRWADEGACTTVEHQSERNKTQQMLIQFLRSGHGIAFHEMFAMKEYPADVLPLYAQGYSLARFLIEQGGRQKFIDFVGQGMKTDNWSNDIKDHYGFENLADLQNRWLDWVKQGSPSIAAKPEELIAAGDRFARGATNPLFRAQSDDRQSPAKNAPIELASAKSVAAAPVSNAVLDRGWTTAAGAQRTIDSAAATRELMPIPSAGDAPAAQSSVYDRRSAAAASGLADVPKYAWTEAPPPRPEASAASSDSPRRDDVLIARHDDATGPSKDHKVLLEWTRRE
jgi:hypothetical protein